MVSNSDIIDNPITAGYTDRKEIKDFIDSINSDVSLLVMSDQKGKVSEISDSENKMDNDDNKIFNQKLVINKVYYLNYFTKTQKWIGHVTKLEDEIFYAQLEDLTNPGTSEIGEFEMAEVSKDDKTLLEIGSTFYWSVGYSHEKGQISKKSVIRFQRVVKWDEEYLDSAVDRAKKMTEILKWK